MSNTSATGGYLTPGMIAPDEDQTLRRFLQRLLSGVTGLVGDMVRPMWQTNPPPVPAIDVNWLAFSVDNQRPDANPYQRQTDDDGMLLVRHEDLDLRCIFYGPNCQKNANLLRDGLYVAQNRERLFLAGVAVVGVSDTMHVPELINDRYFDRADITISMRREIRRDYQVLHFLGAAGTVEANREEALITEDWSTPALSE